MPLKKGKSRKVMASNYEELGNRPRKQKIAIILKQAGISRKGKGRGK